MKRILDSSKTITTCVAGTSKSRECNSVELYRLERRVFKPYQTFLSHPKRSLSFDCPKFRDDLTASVDYGKVHPLPERLCMYWSLDEDNKRKIADPSYVKQAVQETFMQRAHGGYNYKRTHFPVHTSVSHKTTFAPTQKQASSKTQKPKPVKTPEKPHIPKPQVPKRKRFIDTAQPVKHFISKARLLQERRARLGAELKESSEAQLDAMRKKLYDPKPAVLDYLMEKHTPKLSGYQLKTRKEKYQADTAEPPPPFVQRVFGWRKSAKNKPAKEEDEGSEDSIAITPRAIEVRKPSKQAMSLKRLRRQEESAESSEDGKKKSFKFTRSKFEKKPLSNEERRTKRREAQEAEDREAIINKIKSATVLSPRPQREYRSIKTQVRDMDLTPQIYPRGSLSLKKSYLPISPCRQVVASSSSSSMTPKMVVPKATSFVPATELAAASDVDDKPTTAESVSANSFAGSLVNSFKSLLLKIRRRSST